MDYLSKKLYCRNLLWMGDFLMKIGNPDDADSPNKKYYDPRVLVRHSQSSMVVRLEQASADLNCIYAH